jgi:hypothetical protein
MKTRIEVRRLLETFLDARANIMSKHQYFTASPIANDESQDEYGPFQWDLEDPHIIALFVDQVQSTRIQEVKAGDALVAQVNLQYSDFMLRLTDLSVYKRTYLLSYLSSCLQMF